MELTKEKLRSMIEYEKKLGERKVLYLIRSDIEETIHKKDCEINDARQKYLDTE